MNFTFNDKRKLARLLKRYPQFVDFIMDSPARRVLVMSAGYDIGIDKHILSALFSSSFPRIDFYIPKNESFSILKFPDAQSATLFVQRFHGFKHQIPWRNCEISFSMKFIHYNDDLSFRTFFNTIAIESTSNVSHASNITPTGAISASRSIMTHLKPPSPSLSAFNHSFDLRENYLHSSMESSLKKHCLDVYKNVLEENHSKNLSLMFSPSKIIVYHSYRSVMQSTMDTNLTTLSITFRN